MKMFDIISDNKIILKFEPNLNIYKQIMNITLEWEGISGVIKILLIFSIPLLIGVIIGRKTKR